MAVSWSEHHIDDLTAREPGDPSIWPLCLKSRGILRAGGSEHQGPPYPTPLDPPLVSPGSNHTPLFLVLHHLYSFSHPHLCFSCHQPHLVLLASFHNFSFYLSLSQVPILVIFLIPHSGTKELQGLTGTLSVPFFHVANLPPLCLVHV